MTNVCSLILAAGEGKRMKSPYPKVLSLVAFKPMIKWVIDALHESDIDNIGVVCGYKYEILEDYLKNLNDGFNYETFVQNERKGTAHAVITADDFLKKNVDGDILILAGDAPFIDKKIICDSFEFHKKNNNVATIISARLNNPYGYGRIVRNLLDGTITSIVEQKDADENTRTITEVNSGAYWFKVSELLNVIYDISNDNAQKEYYLPDAIRLLLKKNLNVDAFTTESENAILGAHDKAQLNHLNMLARDFSLNFHMKNGVEMPLKDGIIIGKDVIIKNSACILPGSIIKGDSYVGDNSTIGPNAFLENCCVGDNVNLSFVKCKNYNFDAGKVVEPFKEYIND